MSGEPGESGAPPSGLSAVQEHAIVALLGETTIRKAAEVVGVNEKTVHRWLDEPVFQREYLKARREVHKQAMGLIHKAVPLAVATLIGVAQDKSAPHSAKVSASTALLKHSRESMEFDELAARVAAIEQAQRATGNHR